MPRKPKWYDNKLKNLRNKRNKAHRNWKRDKNNHVKLTHFQELRKNFENSVTKAKKQFYWNKFKSCIGDSRQTYKLLNDISGKTKSKTNIPFLDNMAKCTDSENNLHIADAFNEHFVNIAESITKDIPKVAPPVVKEMDYSMFLSEVTENEVEKIIDNLEKKASSGDDLINNIIVKTSKNETVEILTYLINRSFNEGIFPVSLKKAKVIPLHKDGSKTDVNNYRPISLLTVWSKIFERVMYNRIYNYMEHFSLF